MNDGHYWDLRYAAGDCYSLLKSLLELGYIDRNPEIRKMAENAVAKYDAMREEQDKPEKAAA